MSSSEKSSVARSSLIMASGTFVSRVLGMVRSPILLSVVIGLNSPVANAFDIANTLPNILFGLVAGGLINAVLVPAIVSASQRDEDGGLSYINKLLTLSIVLLGSITAILTLAAPAIVKVFVSTIDPQWYRVAVFFAYWCLPQVFFYGLYAVLGQVLNARESFGPYMWAPVFNNVIAIAGLLILFAIYGTPSPEEMHSASIWFGARGTILAAVSTAGIALQAIVLLYPLRKRGIRLRLDFHWKGVGLRETGKTSLWALAAAFSVILPMIVQTNVTAGATQRAIDAGVEHIAEIAGNATYSAAYVLVYAPISLFALSIATAMFTKMAASGARRDFTDLRNHAILTANVISCFNFLCVSLFLVLSVPLARIFVPLGSAAEIQSFAYVIVCMSPIIIGKGIMLTYNRVCYSIGDTRGVFLTNLPSIAIACVLYVCCIWLPPQYTTMAVALVSVLDGVINTVVLLWYVNRKIGGLSAKRLLSSHLRMSIITVAVCLIGIAVTHFFNLIYASMRLIPAFIALIVGGIIVSVMYVAALKLLKVPEYFTMRDIVLSRFKKK